MRERNSNISLSPSTRVSSLSACSGDSTSSGCGPQVPIIDLACFNYDNNYIDDGDGCAESIRKRQKEQQSARDRAIKALVDACSEWGFFQVVNHGIDQELIKKFDEQCRQFFSIVQDKKRQIRRRDDNARGFFDDELTKQRRDWKEALDIGVPYSRDWTITDTDSRNACLDGFNQFPSNTLLPNFRRTMAEYFDKMTQVAEQITELMAVGLGQDEDYFKSLLHNEHTSYLRLNYYPICPHVPEDEDQYKNENDTNRMSTTNSEQGEKEQQQRSEAAAAVPPLGISPHKDAGLLTVLRQDDDCHSLQVRKRGDNSKWITVKPHPGAFTINTGDMLEIWSNGLYYAPEHRVLANKHSVRYSAPFFYNPGYETKVSPLPGLGKPKFRDLFWGYYRAMRFAGDFADYGSEIQIDDFRLDRDLPVSWHIANQVKFMDKAVFTKPFSCDKYRCLLTKHGE